MKIIGKLFFPGLLLAVLHLLPGSPSASEITFFSLPELETQQQFSRFQSEFSPYRRLINLSGKWEILDLQGSRLGSVSVPSSYQGKLPLIFRRTFELHNLKKQIFVLKTEGINGKVRISINDFLLYEGYANYAPLQLLLPGAHLKAGENLIQIELKPNSAVGIQFPSWTPIALPRIDSGILNPPFLEILPLHYIQAVELSPVYQRDSVRVEAAIRLNTAKAPVGEWHYQSTYFYNGKTVFKSSQSLPALGGNVFLLPAFRIAKQHLWSPEKPGRWALEVSLDSAGIAVDRVRVPVALRRLSVNQGGLLLNDRPVSLRGIHYLFQNPESTELFDEMLARQDLMHIKQMGYNAVHVVLHPLPRLFYALCDEVGLLCFQDLPFIVRSVPAPEKASEWQPWKTYLQNMRLLAAQHSSLSGVGLAYYMDAASGQEVEKLSLLLKQAIPEFLPIYVSTLFPAPGDLEGVDFRFVELVKPHPITNGQPWKFSPNSNDFIIPSSLLNPVVSKAFGEELPYQMKKEQQFAAYWNSIQKSLDGPHSFLSTYSDYFLNMPGVMNGNSGKFYLYSGGLVSLSRAFKSEARKTAVDIAAAQSESRLFLSKVNSPESYIYILLGLFNLLFFFLFYQKFVEFRQNLHYSIKKPHGFFVNLQERIIIPYGQSLFLLFAIALNGSIILSSILFYFRSNLLLDYLLSTLAMYPGVKYLLVYLVWNQPVAVVAILAAVVAFFYLIALPIKISSWIARIHVPFRQAVAVSIWAASPFVFLLPFGMFFYNLLLTIKSYWILLGALLYFHLWVYMRWVNGTRIFIEKSYSKTFTIFTVTFLILAGGVFFFYQNQISLWSQLELLYHIFAFAI